MFSMTGFGRAEVAGKEYKAIVEIKSVNHRFKDFRFRMPSHLNAHELNLRRLLEKECLRGSFDISVSLKSLGDSATFKNLDQQKIENFIKHFKELARKTHIEFQFRPSDFFHPDFNRDQETAQSEQDELGELLLHTTSLAVSNLKQSRLEEGKKLVAVIEQHLHSFQKFFHVIETNVETYRNQVEERLRKKFKEIVGELKIDEPRYLQEVVYYLEKLDVHEEINRLKGHILKLRQLLGHGEEKGREIEFLLQEMGRETNTIGSKSGQGSISEMVIQMKVQLEKMREQALNME